MNKDNQNNSYFILGFLAVLAGVFYCLDSGIFDYEDDDKRKKLKDRDSDAFKSDLEALNKDFKKARIKVFESYGIQ